MTVESLTQLIAENPSKAIRRLRKACGLSQKGLATLVGVNYTTVSAHERGVNYPLRAHIKEYASIFLETAPSGLDIVEVLK